MLNNGLFQEMSEMREVDEVKRYESKNYQGMELLDRTSLWNMEHVWHP